MKPKYILLSKDGFNLYTTRGAEYVVDNVRGTHNKTNLFDSIEAAKKQAAQENLRNYTIAAFVMDVEQVPRFDTKVTEYSH